MDEREYWLGFSAFPGIGPLKFQKLITKFGSAKDAWTATATDLSESGIGEVITAKFDTFRNNFSVSSYAKRLQDSKVPFLILTDNEYPDLLKQIKNPPFVLYAKGDIEGTLLGNENFLGPAIRLSSSENFVPSLRQNTSIAVVGTRRVTEYGREVTESLTRELVFNNFTIVSGLALGVDAIAHKTAIENNGKTIAVLGCGVDCCSPRENSDLYNRILSSGGLVISELPLSHDPTRGSFPSRNRIIAGLSLGILVTEGAEDSGSLITADYALKFNRKLFAVPGPITSQLSKGPNSLIEKGAKLVSSLDAILTELSVQQKGIKSIKSIRGESREEQLILDILENEPLHFDEIVRRSNFTSSNVGSVLSVLEIKGIIKSMDSGIFGIVY